MEYNIFYKVIFLNKFCNPHDAVHKKYYVSLSALQNSLVQLHTHRLYVARGPQTEILPTVSFHSIDLMLCVCCCR